MTRPESTPRGAAREVLYHEVLHTFGPAVERLAHAYEADSDKFRDLLQDIHFAIWRSLATFDGRCSLRTWVYRVAHNTAAAHVTRVLRFRRHQFVTLDELDTPATNPAEAADSLDRRLEIGRLRALIQQLAPLDRQVMLCYLEGMDAQAIGELVGMSQGAVAMKVHRVKRVLAGRYHGGPGDGR